MRPRVKKAHDKVLKKHGKTFKNLAEDEFRALCAEARRWYEALSPRDKAIHDIAQMMSFAWGNAECTTNHRVPKALVIKVMKTREDPELVDEAVKTLGWKDE